MITFAIYFLYSMLKIKLLLFFLLFSSVILSQEEKENLFFIDYERDSKWLENLQSLIVNANEGIDSSINIYKTFKAINDASNISISYNNIIYRYINKYLSYRWIRKTYGLLKFYEPLFEMKLKEYNLPIDLKYLAIVESNLNPQAGSWVGASGLWQFMPKTGANYGLAKNSSINLFYDAYASTDAACRYFVFLYNILGDWNLVLSAYNAGHGTVLKAIKKAGSKNYWQVRQYLPDETKAYVPSFHAVRYIGEMYPFLFETLTTLKYDYTNVREITTKKNTTFKEFAKENNLNLKQIYFLNPHIVTENIPKGCFIYYIE